MSVTSHHVVAVVAVVAVVVVEDVDGRVASFGPMKRFLSWMDVMLEVAVACRSCRCC